MIREINGFCDYTISDDGIVTSHKYGKTKVLKAAINSGYYMVILQKDNKRYHKYVHRLVAEYFVPNPNEYEYVDHILGNKLDNRAEMLEWCTILMNVRHSIDVLGNRPFGGKGMPKRGQEKQPVIKKRKEVVYKAVLKLSKDNELIQEYCNTIVAANENDIRRTSLYSAIRLNTIHKGYLWRYK